MLGYLLPPMVLAFGRYRLECAAFEAEMAAIVEIAGPKALKARRGYYVALLTGRPYWYAMCWPGVATRWVDRTICLLTGGEG